MIGAFGKSYKGAHLASEVTLVLGSSSWPWYKASHLWPWGRTPYLSRKHARSFWWERKMDSRMIRQEVRRTERPTKR